MTAAAEENRIRRARFGIGAKLYIALAAAVALTIAASLVAMLAIGRIGELERNITGDAIPDMVNSLKLAQVSSQLTSTAPRLIAAESQIERVVAFGELTTDRALLQSLVEAIRQEQHNAAEAAEIEILVEKIAGNLDALDASVSERLALRDRAIRLETQVAAASRDVTAILLPVIDDQTFYMVTGLVTLDGEPVPAADRLNEEELFAYKALLETESLSTLIANQLGEALATQDRQLLQPIRERYEAATGRIERALERLADEPVAPQLDERITALIALGRGENGVFGVREREMIERANQHALIAENDRIAAALLEEVEALVGRSEDRAKAVAAETARAVDMTRRLLILLNVAAVIGAIAIAWLYVGRRLIRRLEGLAVAMRRMADGDLEIEVERTGSDEVTEMAEALEVFRRHALEVQRLNLVEKLAEEVQAKNAELETTLDELRKAQDRIVMQEKLASLGQLTAGIAHEIKNPLNFVNNFSDVSKELVDEVKEELEKLGDAIGADDRSYIGEILDDLAANLTRINEHGRRADSIVKGMLDHSRGGKGVRAATDVNALVREYANLAYHGIRATDSEFNITLVEELDPEAGRIQATQQDLSRVFLNVVTNACHATDERRRQGETGYEPTVWLKSKRIGDTVEVRVRDNGTGMPPEVAEKIFNPFFTTKPTGQGTGLGLSMSHDVVREHGGQITVETEAGAFTEIVITLPAAEAGPEADDADDEDDAVDEASGSGDGGTGEKADET